MTFEDTYRLADGALDAALQPSNEVLLGDADAETPQVLFQRGRVVRHIERN